MRNGHFRGKSAKPGERRSLDPWFLFLASLLAMFAVAPMSATAGEKAGKCFNVNSCKGTSACATATTSCAGQNSCAGKGWVKRTKSECEDAGGKFEA